MYVKSQKAYVKTNPNFTKRDFKQGFPAKLALSGAFRYNTSVSASGFFRRDVRNQKRE
jgi:hypothetical protein